MYGVLGRAGKQETREGGTMISCAVAILLCSAYGIFLEILTRRKGVAVQNKMPDFVSLGVKDIGKVRKIGKNYRRGAFLVIWALCLACLPLALVVHTFMHSDGDGRVVFFA